MNFKRIKDLREDNDYTQEYIANYLKINRVVYNRYENGIREIPVEIVIKLSKLYNVTTDYILGKINIKNYDIFLKEINEIEENQKCNKCKRKSLVSISPTSYEFMCTKCGNIEEQKSKNYSEN